MNSKHSIETQGVEYRITNTHGGNGPLWDDTFTNRAAAAAAIARIYGWEGDGVIGPRMADDGDDGEIEIAWCVYETDEERDNDDHGAYAPRIVRFEVEEDDEEGERVEAAVDPAKITTRALYLAMFPSTAEAVEFEETCLSADSKLLPAEVVAVKDGASGEPPAAYWQFLAGQAIEREIES